MIFEYDDCADVLWVSISEPAASCVYIEGQTPGVVLRVEESKGIIRGYQILAWRRRIAKGCVMIPELSELDFQSIWLKNQAIIDSPSK